MVLKFGDTWLILVANHNPDPKQVEASCIEAIRQGRVSGAHYGIIKEHEPHLHFFCCKIGRRQFRSFGTSTREGAELFYNQFMEACRKALLDNSITVTRVR